MGYRDIIVENLRKSSVLWWPLYAYHYTEVKNAVSMLSSGTLYSRANANALGVMQNDNASRQVIDMTRLDATANVRFYFRPLTPTQYHNEGYKHPDIRYDGEIYANVPVPVFFVFDLEKLLSMPDIQFSETTQAGRGSVRYNTLEDFAKLPFEKIYSNGFYDGWKNDIAYRHAEILYPRQFNINSCLRYILCRNDIERATLLNLLKSADKSAYQQYLPIIKVCKRDMFYSNGLFITDMVYHNNIISLSFCDTYERQNYARKAMEKMTCIPCPR